MHLKEKVTATPLLYVDNLVDQIKYEHAGFMIMEITLVSYSLRLEKDR